MQIQKPIGDQIGTFFIDSGKHNIDIYKAIDEILKLNDLKTPAKTLKAQNILNNIVAEEDPSVNNVIFNLIIEK